MATTIAEYFAVELAEWADSITFYGQEMEQLKHRLDEVIRRNTVMGIAQKVEAHLSRLDQVSQKFYGLLSQIQKQETTLRSDSALIVDELIREDTEKKQNELRRSMHQTEKEYIDIKYECYHFLSGTLKK